MSTPAVAEGSIHPLVIGAMISLASVVVASATNAITSYLRAKHSSNVEKEKRNFEISKYRYTTLFQLRLEALSELHRIHISQWPKSWFPGMERDDAIEMISQSLESVKREFDVFDIRYGILLQGDTRVLFWKSYNACLDGMDSESTRPGIPLTGSSFDNTDKMMDYLYQALEAMKLDVLGSENPDSK